MTELPALEFELMQGDSSSAAVAEVVVRSCLSDESVGRVAILESPFLRSRRLRALLAKDSFKVLSDPSSLSLTDWVEPCLSHGHMSVWFLSMNPRELVSRIGERVQLGHGRPVQLGSGSPSDPLGESQRESLERFLASGAIGDVLGAVCLSHDAAQLYEVLLNR